jgi:two-component system response regulator AtoC
MPNLDGIGLLRALTLHEPNLPVILLTAHGSVDSAVEAVKLGAFDYLEKPFDRDQIHQIVQKAIATRERAGPSAATAPPAEESRLDPCTHAGMVGRSPQMQAIREIVSTGRRQPLHSAHHRGERHRQGAGRPRAPPRLAAAQAALHQGQLRRDPERPGRERALRSRARRLHRRRRRARGPLRAGRRRHPCSSTKSARSRPRPRSSCCGCCRSRQFERVGGVKTLRVHVRLIAATNRDLEDLIKDGASARTSTTGSTSSRSTCPRCASASRTSRCWSPTSSALQRAPRQGRPGPHARRTRRARALPLARQHPRAREPDRAHGPVRLRPMGRRGRPARRLRRR